MEWSIMGLLGADNIIFLHLNVGYGGDGGVGGGIHFVEVHPALHLFFCEQSTSIKMHV